MSPMGLFKRSQEDSPKAFYIFHCIPEETVGRIRFSFFSIFKEKVLIFNVEYIPLD